MILALVFLLTVAGPAWAELGLPDAIGRPVTRVEIANRSREPTAEIRRLFLLRAGDAYDPRAVQRSLLLLSQKPSIRNVVVQGEPDGEGVVVRVEVRPEALVRSVAFRGNCVLEDAQMATRLKTRVDRPVRPVYLAADADTIRELYKARGFPRAAVDPRVARDEEDHWAVVTFRIEEGEPRRILRVEIPQPLAMTEERALALVGLHAGDPASEPQLRDGVERLVKVLRREGYPEARAAHSSFRSEAGGVVLVLRVVAGERVDVRIEGMDEWTASPLRDLAESRYGEPLDEEWARRVADEMEDSLRGEGYRSASVTPEFGHRYGRRRLTFHVARGPRVHVERVTFEGNDAIPADRLEPYMSVLVGGLFGPPAYTQGALERDLRVLREYYASHGFLDAQVEVAELTVSPSGEARLRLRVREGPRYELGRVSFAIDGALTEEEARRLADLDPGSTADPGALQQARLSLLEKLEQEGYADRKVTYDTHRRSDPARLDVTYAVTTGERVHFGRVVVGGNARTQTKVIRRELTFERGAPWSEKATMRSRQQLYRLGFFERVQVERLGPLREDGVQDVLVQVAEQDAGSVTFGLGYGTEEGVKGFGELSHANLFGSGRSLGFRAEFDRFNESYAVNFREPWLFDRPYDLRLSLVKSFEDRKTFNRSSLGFQASLEKEVTENILASLLYTLESNRLSSVTEEAESVEGTYLLSAIGPVVAWDSRDDPFNPRRGYYHTFQAEWASDLLGSQVRYERYLGTVSGFFTMRDFTLALLARGGIAFTLGQTADLPVNKRFFLGGRTTVRGFGRDEVGPKADDGTPLGGDVMLNLKAEIRFPLYGSFGGALFWDAGNVWDRRRESPAYGELRQAVGGGLRYNTPVGPLSLDVGVKLRRREDEAPWAWHFTVGNVF